MPSMKRDSTLRADPGGQLLPVIGTEGARIDILGQTQIVVLGTQQDWTKIRLVDADEPSTGWVQSDRVDAAGMTSAGQIDEVKFVRECWLEALIADVTPHYLLTVAQLRSSRSQNTVKGDVGPFGFTQQEWDAYCQDGTLALTDYRSVDIFDWGMQCVVFAEITARLQSELSDATKASPSASQLFLAQMIGTAAAAALIKSTTDTVAAALADTADKDLPAGGFTRDQLIERFSPFLGTAIQPATGKEALALITAAIQPILDATRRVVDDVGKEYLGLLPHDGEIDKADDPGLGKVKPTSPPRTPKTGGPTVAAGAGGPLGELIAKHESGSAGYGAFNRGVAGIGGKLDFSNTTLGQIVALQALTDKTKRLFAVGKYQLIPLTMKGAISQMSLDPKQTYDPSLQENMFRNYLISNKRPAIKSFIVGDGASLRAAQMALAFEFASVARPDTGRSNYGGVGGNNASISAEDTRAALEEEASLYKALVLGGQTPDDAWNALSPGI